MTGQAGQKPRLILSHHCVYSRIVGFPTVQYMYK